MKMNVMSEYVYHFDYVMDRERKQNLYKKPKIVASTIIITFICSIILTIFSLIGYGIVFGVIAICLWVFIYGFYRRCMNLAQEVFAEALEY